MRRRHFLCAIATPMLGADTPNYSRLVYPGKDGRLAYTPDERGNRIPDFSLCGYRGGSVPLPDVPVRAELSPESGDATARVQAAVDRVSACASIKAVFVGRSYCARGDTRSRAPYASPRPAWCCAARVTARVHRRRRPRAAISDRDQGSRSRSPGRSRRARSGRLCPRRRHISCVSPMPRASIPATP